MSGEGVAPTYSLEFNGAGSWRKVVAFEPRQMASIKAAAQTLLRITHNAKGRIVAPDGTSLGGGQQAHEEVP
jgi:hypothetical protein